MYIHRGIVPVVWTMAVLSVSGCSNSSTQETTQHGGNVAGISVSGGEGAGGMPNSGGSVDKADTGRADDRTSTGGDRVTDGNPNSGGWGGNTSTGGTTGSGGSASAGGVASSGGTPHVGGTMEIGGATGSGGVRNPGLLKKFVGNITTRGQVRSDFVQYWDQITPENEGKWDAVEPSRDKMNWGALDKIYEYAKQNHILFKEHTFVWGSQQPGWIGGLSKSEQAEEVEEWIRLFCERYPDVAMIDVVNEPPPHTKPAVYEALGGAGTTGYDWVATAFRWARTYCPKSVLILNDYNVLAFVTSDIINIANALKGLGLIDGLGSQSHGQEGQSIADLKANLDKLIAVGLPVYITEFDLSTADDQKQLELYKAQFPLFWETPEVKGITLWGYVYGSTWGPAKDSGLLKGTTERPAMTWLMNYIGR